MISKIGQVRLALIGISLLISFLYGFHHLLWLRDLDWDYKQAIFVTLFKPYDANHYLTQIKEIYEGNDRLSNAFIAEYKQSGRSFWPIFPFYLVGLLGKSLHLEVQYVAVLMDFTLPPLIFLLAYALLVTVSQQKKTSLVGAFVLVMMPHICQVQVLVKIGASLFRLAHSLNLSDLIPPLWDAHAYHDGYSRPINPQLTFTFLLSALLFFVKGVLTGQRKYLGLAIVFGTITSYSYIYFSSYLYLFWAIFAGISAGLGQRQYVRRTLTMLSVTLAFAVPFWYSVFAFSNAELTQVTLMEHTHTPIVTPQVVWMLLLCGLIAMLWYKGFIRQFTGIITLALLLSSIGCLNQRVVTGLEVQSWHYETHLLPQSVILALTLLAAEYGKNRSAGTSRLPSITLTSLLAFGGLIGLVLSAAVTPAVVVAHVSSDGILTSIAQWVLTLFRILAGLGGAVVLSAAFFLRRRKFWQKSIRSTSLLAASLIGLVAVSVGLVQYRLYYGFIKPHLGYIQELAPALRWLDTHTEKESVVLCSLNYTTPHVVIPIYTHNNVYTAPLMECYPSPTLEETWDRKYNTLYFMGVTSRAEFEKYVPQNTQPVRTFEDYQKKFQQDVYTALKRYRVDYVFYGPLERQSFQVDPGKTYAFLKEVYHDPVVTIYQIL